MSPEFWILAGAVAAYGAWRLGAYLIDASYRRAASADAAAAASADQGRVDAARAAAKASEADAETVQRAIVALEEAVREVEAWKQRFEHAFASIEKMEKQRDEWKRMYYAAGQQYAAGAEMLFREIERLSLKAKEPVRPHLADMVQGFRAEHALSPEVAQAKVDAAVAAANPAR